MTRFVTSTVFAVFLLMNPPAIFAADQTPPAAENDKAPPQDAGTDKQPAAQAAAGFPPLDPQMQRAKDSYEAALKSLTPEQLAELEALGAEFASTMEVDMQILQRSAQMEHCLTYDGFFKADTENVKSFVTWRSAMKAEQRKRQDAHKLKRLKITYVKPYVLDRYYVVYQTRLLKMLGMIIAKNAYDKGMYKDTDCDDLSKRLKHGL